MSRSSGSKWMSEAPSSTAWAITEFTSLITGASSADSRISVTSASSSSPCSTAAATASSSRLMRPTSSRMSSCDPTTGITSWPVMSFRSSSASTFEGSAMATRRCPASSKPIGAAASRRAACAPMRLSAPTSALNTARSTCGRPKRCAVARASWSAVIAWDSRSRISGARPADFPSATAASTRSRGRKPISTITSEMKRDPPRRFGRVSPRVPESSAVSAPGAGTARSGAGPPGGSVIGRRRLLARGPRRRRSPR